MKFVAGLVWAGFLGYCVGHVVGETVGNVAEKAILKYYGVKGE